MAKRITTHQNCELPDLGEELSFTFNGKRIKAFTGDSITSALIASGSNQGRCDAVAGKGFDAFAVKGK